MRWVLRVVLLLGGLALCVIGVSAATKLFRDTLDSPRALIAVLALITFLGGAVVIGAVINDVRHDRPR
jgi:hypothetical protein